MAWSLPASLRPRRGVGRRLAFALVPVVLLSGALEVGTRLFVEPASFAAGGPLGWTAAPGLEELEVPTAAGHFLVSTNEDGLRTELPRERSGAERWATFGDSTVFGWGVAVEDSPAGTLQELRPGVEVLNAGQPGYSGEQARRLAEQVLPLYRPDKVLWFHPWHDLATGRPDRELLPTDLGSFERLLLRSAFVQHLRRPKVADNELFAFSPDYGGSSERVPEAHRWDNAQRLAAACEDIGAELILVLLPVNGGGRSGGFSFELEGHAHHLGLRFVDLNSEPSPRPWEELTVVGDPGHLNALGNELYMKQLLQALDEPG